VMKFLTPVDRLTYTPYLKKPKIFWNNFAKTDPLSMIFGREDRHSLAYRLRVKRLIPVKNHLRGFHRNSSTIAG